MRVCWWASRRSYLPIGELGVLGGGAAVVTFELVLGLFEEGVQAISQVGPVASRPCLFSTELLQSPRQQSLLHIGVPAATHFLWDLGERRRTTVIHTETGKTSSYFSSVSLVWGSGAAEVRVCLVKFMEKCVFLVLNSWILLVLQITNYIFSPFSVIFILITLITLSSGALWIELEANKGEKTMIKNGNITHPIFFSPCLTTPPCSLPRPLSPSGLRHSLILSVCIAPPLWIRTINKLEFKLSHLSLCTCHSLSDLIHFA